MTHDERDELFRFCIYARADIEGIDESEIDSAVFGNMTDAELEREADWLDDMMGK